MGRDGNPLSVSRRFSRSRRDSDLLPASFASSAESVVHTLDESDLKQLALEIASEVVKKLKEQNAENPSPARLRIGPDEMCQSLGIKRRTLTDWQRRRIIPFERIGPSKGRSTILFDPPAVDKALQRWRIRSVSD